MPSLVGGPIAPKAAKSRPRALRAEHAGFIDLVITRTEGREQHVCTVRFAVKQSAPTNDPSKEKISRDTNLGARRSPHRLDLLGCGEPPPILH